MANYQQQQQKLSALASKYAAVPNDLNMFPGLNVITMAPPNPGCQNLTQMTFQAGLAGGGVPANRNPAGQLYSRGLQNLTLTASQTLTCSPGCVAYSSNPSNSVVKPLYKAHSYKMSNNMPMPTVHNVTGMY